MRPRRLPYRALERCATFRRALNPKDVLLL
jgi:hypothetical protein